jgi:hypothetical protein
MARLEDTTPVSPAGPPSIGQWVHVPVIQGSERSLKFVVPANWRMGVFAYRVSAGGESSEAGLLNAPDPWWAQGDEGDAATPGGWLRVLGKSLATGGHELIRLGPEKGAPIDLVPRSATDYSLGCDLPGDLKPGVYGLEVHNGAGGDAAWRSPGKLRVVAPVAAPTAVFNVLETCGPDAAKEMRDSLIKYRQPIDRTDGIGAALTKARENGGGVVYFPPGRYMVRGALEVPAHTVLRGEGQGLVSLWWGSGHFNLDGGGDQGRARVEEPKPPQTLISGTDFGIQDMSLYLPLDYAQGIVAEDRLRMARVRVRIDHYWLVQGRGNGTVVRIGRNGQVTDCDILAKGDAIVPGKFGLIAHNRVAANKSNTPMGGSENLIVEDNQFISMDPTAYQNISGTGRNIFYGHNHHEALYAQQSDYSCTFDAGASAYTGTLAAADGTRITLAADPTYPKWADEKSDQWRRAAVFILEGRGAGQWRDVVSNQGRKWEIDRPFDVPPDGSSFASIVSFNGRVLIVGNHFEDANWVNAGYGTSVDVVCAGNTLLRCAELMNHGVCDIKPGGHGLEPSWHVQYFDNQVEQGQTSVGSHGAGHKGYDNPLTDCAIHRRQTLSADNSGGISVSNGTRDVIVEGCVLQNPASTIKADDNAKSVLFRNNTFGGSPSPRYEGKAANE